ncbi:hypothetical protein [Fructobacillus parabroussonetiae]|uniref:Lipoprotein n=1 Tax=Fructobacillus parabroussonetiae TaxID=2713174 RepID=A0ABS5QXT7_9LACO|nr:hypothetical protein [Fructobacillus parabroussonetiae]MBS9338016.1 hypothetical protein [Fructobacillus parabroussonetiae]
MKKVFSIVILIGVIILGFLVIKEKHHNHLLKEEVKEQSEINKKEQSESQNKESTTEEQSESQNKESTTEDSTVDKKELVKKALLNQLYIEKVTKYNDIDIEEAMRQSTSPKNLFHDEQSYYFDSDYHVIIKNLSNNLSGNEGGWSVDDQNLTITIGGGGGVKVIPYVIQDNKVKFNSFQWKQYGTEGTFTSTFISNTKNTDS